MRKNVLFYIILSLSYGFTPQKWLFLAKQKVKKLPNYLAGSTIPCRI
jgi:hypothetical protein